MPMSPRERLFAAMRREDVDKVPCSPRLGEALRILYRAPQADAVDLALRAADPHELDLDPHFVTTSGVPSIVAGTSSEVTGLSGVTCTRKVTDDGPCDLIERAFETPAGSLREVIRQPKPGRLEYGLAPNPIRLEPLVKGPEDLPALACLLPDPSRCALLADYRRLADRVGSRGVVEVMIRGPLDHRAGLVVHMETLMVAYYHDRPFFDALFGLFHDHMMSETRAVLEAGVEVIFGSWYYASLSAGWSPAIFREIFLPSIASHVALCHDYGALYDYYDDGRVMGIAEWLAEAGVDVLETLTPPPVGDADLLELKRQIGERVCLKGYVDLLYVIKHGTPEQVTATVRDAIQTAGPRGFILGTSDSIREGTPPENVAAYFRAASEFGQVAARPQGARS